MKGLLFSALLFAAHLSFAQVKVSGTVRDSLDQPLALANVIAIEQESNAMGAFGISSENGTFTLELGANKAYEIQISYVGMKTLKEVLETGESDLEKDFVLQPDNVLDEVELVYEMPVTVKGDTLVYNADSFNTGTERKLEDVLENLPGVEINEDRLALRRGSLVSQWSARSSINLWSTGRTFLTGIPSWRPRTSPQKRWIRSRSYGTTRR